MVYKSSQGERNVIEQEECLIKIWFEIAVSSAMLRAKHFGWEKMCSTGFHPAGFRDQQLMHWVQQR